MECFISHDDDRILLVGEGNFSFSVDFVNYVEKKFTKFFSHHEKYNIISTCFEPESEISSIASVNSKLLQEKGIEVEFGIDARCLEQCAFLAKGTHRQQKFSRIIFNFPHVGGKMRIERNRKLLRDFLVSGRQVVQPDGAISVALCAGQGGSTVENVARNPRRWDDSWKAVEAAGEAGMLLVAVLPFPPASILQQYSSTGYRGLQKGFCLTDARVHIFRPTLLPLPNPLSLEEMDSLQSRVPINNTNYQRAHADKIIKSPWKRSESAQSKFLDRFISYTNDIQCEIIDKIVVCGDVDEHGYASSSIKGMILRCLSLNELTNDFSVAPVECVAKLICVDAFDVACRTLGSMFGGDDYERFLVFGNNDDVTILVDRLMGGDWRKLWTNGIACVSPHSYTLDITFSMRSVLCEPKLVEVLWSVGGDFIVDIERLSEFVFEGETKINYCYRIVYRSYEMPLFRAKIIKIHNEVVARALEYHLDATVV